MTASARDDFWLQADSMHALLLVHSDSPGIRLSSTGCAPDAHSNFASNTRTRSCSNQTGAAPAPNKSVVELALLEYLRAAATATATTASATASATASGTSTTTTTTTSTSISGICDAEPLGAHTHTHAANETLEERESASLDALRRRANAQRTAVALLSLLFELHVRELRQPLSLLLDPLPEWQCSDTSSESKSKLTASASQSTWISISTARHSTSAKGPDEDAHGFIGGSSAAKSSGGSSQTSESERASRRRQARTGLLHDLLELCTENLFLKCERRSRTRSSGRPASASPDAKRPLVVAVQRAADSEQRAAVGEYAQQVELVFAMQHTFEETAESSANRAHADSALALSSAIGELQRYQILQLYLFGLDQIALSVLVRTVQLLS